MNCGINSRSLKKLAISFSSAMKYDYIYTLGNSQKKIRISILSNEKEDFTHIFGLDHLSETEAVQGNNRIQKIRIFKNILNNCITMDTISNDSNLCLPLEKTWNELEKREYTIYDRIYLCVMWRKV